MLSPKKKGAANIYIERLGDVKEGCKMTYVSRSKYYYKPNHCSRNYVKILKDNGIEISMSDKANPYDNAKSQSFFRTLKVEEVYMSDYETYDDVLASIPYFIEEVYNRKRLHSSLGYMPLKNLNINLIKIRLISWF